MNHAKVIEFLNQDEDQALEEYLISAGHLAKPGLLDKLKQAQAALDIKSVTTLCKEHGLAQPVLDPNVDMFWEDSIRNSIDRIFEERANEIR